MRGLLYRAKQKSDYNMKTKLKKAAAAGPQFERVESGIFRYIPSGYGAQLNSPTSAQINGPTPLDRSGFFLSKEWGWVVGATAGAAVVRPQKSPPHLLDTVVPVS